MQHGKVKIALKKPCVPVPTPVTKRATIIAKSLGWGVLKFVTVLGTSETLAYLNRILFLYREYL